MDIETAFRFYLIGAFICWILWQTVGKFLAWIICRLDETPKQTRDRVTERIIYRAKNPRWYDNIF